MRIAVALLLLASPQDGEDPVSLGLRYLARHQAADGSWGARPDGCGCDMEPAGPDVPADPAARERIDALLRSLEHDDVGTREYARKRLIEIGPPALPQLQSAAENGPPETRWASRRVMRAIRNTGTAQDVEATAMVLMTFLSGGHSPLSKALLEGRSTGTVVKEGLKWLIARQNADGSFDGTTPAGQAWAALALSEAYGMTAIHALKDPAQRAIDYLVAHPAQDARVTLYQGMAIKSAELSELTYPREVHDRAAVVMAARRAHEPASVFVRASTQILQIFAYRNMKRLDLMGLPGIDASRMEVETVYAVTLALFQANGPHGPHWKAWNEQEKLRIVPLQERVAGRCDRGSWSAEGTRERIRTCALLTLSREIYYR